MFSNSMLTTLKLAVMVRTFPNHQSQHTGPPDQSEYIVLFRGKGFIERQTAKGGKT